MFGTCKQTDKKVPAMAAEEPGEERAEKNSVKKENAEPKREGPAEEGSKESSIEVELAAAKLAVSAAEAALEAARKENASTKDQLLRTMADFDNYRKRQARDREQMEKRACANVLEDLLPVVDHLEVALSKCDTEKDDPFMEGIRLVHTQFIDALRKHGLTPIDAKGEKFDPAIHEALSQMPSSTVPAQFVMEQFRRGWMLADRLLRPAQVIVSSGEPPVTQEVEEESISD